MKKKIIWSAVSIVAIGGLIWTYQYLDQPEVPKVGLDGQILGEVSIESILTLNQPYRCTLEKSDGVSKLMALLYLHNGQVYADFNIESDSLVDKTLSSFMVIKGGEAYTWTSVSNLGYKTKAARSALRNASPREQAQILGTRDRMPYKCKPWEWVDDSYFEVPDFITFSQL